MRLVIVESPFAPQTPLPPGWTPPDIAGVLTKWRASLVDDETRCAVCGWPLASSVDAGCVVGNCSQRPLPQTLYAPARAARERNAK